MLVETAAVAQFEIVLISDDEDHAHLLMADLDTSQHRFSVTCVSDRGGVMPALDRLTERQRRKLPVIVMLDFEFLQDSCEALAAHIVELQSNIAIECIVTRPPPAGKFIDRLHGMGAFLFDPDGDFAPPVRQLH